MSSLISSLGASLLPRFDVLDSKLDSLDVQVPDDLAAKLANLYTAISNIDLSSVGSSFFTKLVYYTKLIFLVVPSAGLV